MDRRIKFRGRVVATDKLNSGQMVYGSYVEYSSGQWRYWIHPLDGEKNYPVERDSVAQLIGLDADGNEVYEGDIIYLDIPEDNFYKEYEAHWQGFARAEDGCWTAAERWSFKYKMRVKQ